MAPVRLLRRLVLENPVHTPDGAGGYLADWVETGTLWADVTVRTARVDVVGARQVPRMLYRIVVRGAPVGAPSRPRPGQRLRDGARIFDVLTVTERDGEGRYLEIQAEEGVAT